jgi:hypothetical protein
LLVDLSNHLNNILDSVWNPSDLNNYLFNTGCSIFQIQAYASCAGKHGNTSISWVVSSAFEQRHVSEGNTLSSEPKQTVRGLKGLASILNYGSTTKKLITCMGLEFVNEREKHYKIQQTYRSLALLSPELLPFIENKHVLSIHQMSEDHCQEHLNMNSTQIKDNLNPNPL